MRTSFTKKKLENKIRFPRIRLRRNIFSEGVKLRQASLNLHGRVWEALLQETQTIKQGGNARNKQSRISIEGHFRVQIKRRGARMKSVPSQAPLPLCVYFRRRDVFCVVCVCFPLAAKIKLFFMWKKVRARGGLEAASFAPDPAAWCQEHGHNIIT